MPYPRHLLVPPDAPGTYHCVSRCVRRAFLCGEDPVSGQSYEHRKDWLESRILELGALFAVAVHAYAVMSNHVHLVLDIDPCAPKDWSDEDVARRWVMLSSSSSLDLPIEARIARLLEQPERLAELRQRLGSLSWFMRLLKEPIARKANREDGCTGRFWEGRFKTQAILDDTALVACMAYVDLNPVRAGRAQHPELSTRTSLCHRLSCVPALPTTLDPVAASIPGRCPELTLSAYRALLAWTASCDRHNALPAVAPKACAALRTLRTRPEQWTIQVGATESQYWRAIGTANSLMERAAQLGQRWLCGLGIARTLVRMSSKPA